MKTIPNNSASPRLRVRLILLALLLAFGIIPNTHAAESPPNIVIIFIDDMGYGDIGPFGNTVNQTPHLDRMAAEGNVLREFYVSNTACTPSRSALLTGTYAHRIGMDGTVCFPGEDRGLNPDEITIAEILKEKGYTTGCFGKWHLGDQVPFLPLAQGFDQYFGIPYSNDMWPGNARGNPLTNRGPYTPLPVLRQNEVVAHVADGADQSLLAESITDHAVNFIKQNKDKPFFLYLPHAYVHSPRYARPDILKKAQGDINRANVEEVDTSVGRILDTLRDLDLAENTLVLFTSDNGGAGGMSMGPLRGGKGGAKYEGHMREPTIAWWPGKIPAGSETNEIAVTTDLLPSLAKLTGAKVPKDRTIDGKDVLDILLGKPTAKSPHELHYYEVDGIRRGPWKLVRIGNKTELYNLDEDLGERNDLAAKHPAMVKELTDLLDAHAAAIAADTRPAGYVRAGTGKPLISKVGDLPTLRDFVGLPETKAAETHIARAGDLNKKQPPKANRKLPANRQPLKAGGKAKDVLFIAIDDMNDWTTLFDDDNPIQTPNLKRLAARGTFFNRAYCASPGCNPSRTAIMTGLRPTSSGVYGNPEVWAEKLPDVITLPQYFEKHGGYATRGAGKIFHHGKSGADRPHNPSFQEFFQKLAIRGPGPNNNYNGYKKPDHPRLGNVGFDWGEHDQKMIDVDMCEWVEARMEEDFDKPLFLAAGIFNPHLPFYAPKETFDRYPLDETVLPVMKKGDLDDVGEIAKRMVRKEFWVYDNTTSKEPGSPGSLQRMVQSYQAATDYADQMVGRLLDKLDETGRAENTIIVLWSDHGYHLGDKESCVKFTLWEKANRVPFIVVAPGVGKPDQICSRPVSLIDIYPTLLDLAGLPPNAENDGQSLVPLLKNPNREWERPALMTEGPGNHAVRSDRWRYIRYSDGTEELYDHDNDPWEHHNVASDPKHAKVIAQHRRWIPKKEASGKGMDHLYQSPPPAGAGLPNSGYSKTRAARGTKTTEVKTPKTDILIADFEGDTYADWTVEGEAFGSGPAQGTLPRQMPVSGFHGKGLANSFVGGDNATGVLTSPPFKIERPFMNFSIGGGSHTGQTCINLLVGGKIVRNASGPNPRPDASEKMVASTWDLSELAGKTASIQIVDQRTGGWGHITIDHLVLSDKPIAKPIAPVALMELDKTLQVDGTHLLIPVANEGDQINLGIYEDDHLVQSFNVTLPKRKGQHWLAAYPLSKFDLKGKTIRVAPTEGPLLPDTFSHAFDLIQIGTEETVNSDDDYQHPYRDQFHASVRRGWNNDPNGMVYHDGKFHLYYQYNPFGIRWGNMHWGHLQSPDLLHWEEKPIALYQNTTSDMMFSGGGFIDFNNTAGFGENTLFVAFTSTGRGECLAYSTDGGMTFTEMEENPIIEHKGRDPKIIWYEPEQKWILAVYNFESCAETEAIPAKEGTLPKRLHNNIAFWESKNLREWKRTGAFTHEDRDAVHECPELFELPIKGKPNESRWILYGAQNRYFIGDFDGKTFHAESGPHGDPRSPQKVGPPGGRGTMYAAQTFSDVPDGRRIQMGWIRTAPDLTSFPDQIVSQSMSLPHELVLQETDRGLRLLYQPVAELKNLRMKLLSKDPDGLSSAAGQLAEIQIEFEEPSRHELVINGIDASFDGSNARIFSDRNTNELYIDGGLEYLCYRREPEQTGSTETKIKSDSQIKSLRVHQIESIWQPGLLGSTDTPKAKGPNKQKAENAEQPPKKGGKKNADAKPAPAPFPVVEHLLPPAKPSLLPQYEFANTLKKQEKQLATNPLLKRFAASRKALADDPHRPFYHYVNPEGRLNDPNGLCYWKGRWHLFYQAYPPEDPRQHWGHAVSDDLIHWRDLPVAIYPVPEDKCFSGSTLVEEDRVIAAYHGIGRGTMIAVSSDPLLLNWEKVSGDAVIKLKNENDPDLPYEVFDPSIWKEGDYYYLLTAGQTKTGPAGKVMRQQFLHRSKDLANWEYLHPFVENDYYGMVGDDGACPYFWPIGTPEQNKHIMLHFSHMSGGKYLLGDYDTKRQKFVVTDGGDFNHGPVSPGGTHAPSACPDPNDPEAVIGLFNMNPGIRTPGFNHWNQVMSLPRRWTLSDEGKLLVEPAGDIKSLRRNHERITSLALPKDEEVVIESINGNAMEMHAKIGRGTSKMIELKVLRSPNEEEFTRILVHPMAGYKVKDGVRRDRQQRVFTHGTLTIDTSRSSTLTKVLPRPPEIAPYLLDDDPIMDLRVFVDKSIVEVFINGVQCAAVRVYPGREDSTGVSLRAIGGDAQLISLNAWQMENIYE